ncbi:MAG: hypothetical protein J7L11_09445 [Thermoprotei archaeon]|nr:hypothetical protein [Thermoprotei archaeon]
MRRREYLWLALILMIASMLGGTFSTALPLKLRFPLMWLFIELTTACLIFTVLYISLISMSPRRVKPEDVFTGGASRPPYISSEELYSTGIPYLGNFDERWELYRDRTVFKG